MQNVDKIIFVNRMALSTKYGPPGLASIDAALARSAAADKARGLSTFILAIDDPAAMAKVGGNAVVGPADERLAKAAVDAAYAALMPSFGMLLDGPDVIPHITLSAIAGLSDSDTSIASDLPYASPGGWSRKAANYLTVTRAIGRLPAAAGATSADDLVSLLDMSADHNPPSVSTFRQPFAMSANVWLGSTQLSLATTFGAPTPVRSSPPDGHPAIDKELGRQIHFVNCHGAIGDPNFYGQSGQSYPIAMSSKNLAPSIRPGTLVAAECCYGAELYDFNLLATDKPICLSYLIGGATAFVGSTCIAYGPAVGNGQADLLAQYFLQHSLTGMSIGQAFLEARQEFIRTQTMSNPANLKTLAQFILLGDPSLRGCQTDTTAEISVAGAVEAKASSQVVATEIIDENAQLKSAFGALHGSGLAGAASATRTSEVVDLPEELAARITSLAKDHGMSAGQITALNVSGGPLYRAAAKSQDVTRKVVTAVDRTKNELGHPAFKIMVAYMIDTRVSRIEVIESR